MPRFDQTWRPAAMTRSTIRTMSIETGGKRNDEQRSHVPAPAGICRRHAGDHPKLRHASCDNARVLLHMLEVIDLIGREAKSPEGAPNVLIWVLLPTAKRLGVLPRAPPSRRPKAQRN
jgi:hypothetical protein